MNVLTTWQKELAGAGWFTVVSTVIDIILVAALVYWLTMLSKRTRAWHIIIGLIIYFCLVFLTSLFQLHTLNYLLGAFLPLIPVAVVILFYPELRHILENLGKAGSWGRGFSTMAGEDISSLVHTVVKATVGMSNRQIGALIVIEREHALDDIAATGTKLDAEASEELIGSIFNPGSPLHDGAVIVRGKRIIAAGCILPLSENAHVGTMVHTRHKAALGVAEESDAAVVVVSEETGTISLALEGKLHRGLDEDKLTQWLKRLSASEERAPKSKIARKVNGTIRSAGRKLK